MGNCDAYCEDSTNEWKDAANTENQKFVERYETNESQPYGEETTTMTKGNCSVRPESSVDILEQFS